LTFGPNGVDSPLGLLIEGTIGINPSGPCKQIAPTLEEISNEMANDVVLQNTILIMSLTLLQSMESEEFQLCYFFQVVN